MDQVRICLLLQALGQPVGRPAREPENVTDTAERASGHPLQNRQRGAQSGHGLDRDRPDKRWRVSGLGPRRWRQHQAVTAGHALGAELAGPTDGLAGAVSGGRGRGATWTCSSNSEWVALGTPRPSRRPGV